MSLDFHPRTRVVFGAGILDTLGRLARDLGFHRALLVADDGVAAAGYVSRALRILEAEGIAVHCFHGFAANPDTRMAEAGRAFASALTIDSIVALGGGSSLDCAKAINFLLTNGGSMRDYHGWAKASQPMLPMIGIPTTAGTGSEAQTYALISDSETHVKMACGDPKAAFRIALLDPEICLTAPAAVRATSGYDAISHAVETWVTTRRNPVSLAFARQAWSLLSGAFEKSVQPHCDVETMGGMLLGSHLAGMAIENSMLGATHACANPLTARYGTTHGVAIAMLLPHVVRFNEPAVNGLYRELHADLPARLGEFAAAAALPANLRAAGVDRGDFPSLAEAAAQQWTGRFNPRPFDASHAREIYECAW